MATVDSARRESSSRLYWADTAKAIAVVLVVLYHVSPIALVWLVDGESRGEALIGEMSRALLPVRMPLFFFVSGLLAVNAFARPWRAVLQKRVINLLWVFVLWTVLYAFPYAYSAAAEDVEDILRRALLWAVNLSGAYWFLPMLVLMFVAMKLTQSVHPRSFSRRHSCSASGPVASR
ncbi:acyltransferase family protein [Flaviflexus equikiangi]|uniref:acyltransferase family protein n=1 Tax=Flaviflexus equikiangi TaxID=2758573 RepID=UPI0015F3E5D6|nr:acyltransferase family protein [Flaviflexus equikiangi]